MNTRAPRLVRWFSGGLLALLMAALPPGARATTSAHSVSGQFIVRAPLDPLLPFEVATNGTLVQFDATSLSVSAERIKRALALQIGDLGPWRGKIMIDVFPARSEYDQALVTSERFTDSWQYRVELPSPVSRPLFVRTLLNALLLEYANRNPGGNPAEIPFWLVEGLTWRLLEVPEMELVVPTPKSVPTGIPMTAVQRQSRRDPPLEAARKVFQQQPPLSFEELSWPGLRVQEGLPDDVFSRSAQLIVTRLLQLQDGPARTRRMLQLLPQHANWQFAFLDAYSFERPLEAEKWWALQVAHFTSRNPDETWDLPTSLQKLEAVLITPIQVHSETNGLPTAEDLSLPAVLRTWEPEPTRDLLDAKIRDLALLRLRIAPQLLLLLDRYLATLGEIRDNLPRKRKPKFGNASAQLVESLDRLRAGATPSPATNAPAPQTAARSTD